MPKRFYYWTPITAFCFERKFKCKDCSEAYFCARKPINNDLGLKAYKFSALQTYANIGLKGFDEALYKIGQQKNRMKDTEL